MKKYMILLSMLILFGCARPIHGYRPGSVPLEDKHLQNIPRGSGTVSVVNVTESEVVNVLSCCLVDFPARKAAYSDLKDWGEDICKTLKDALERLGYIVSDSGEKVIKIRVTKAVATPGLYWVGQTVLLGVEMGDGTKLDMKVAKRSGVNWYRAAYGSVMDATYNILTNETVQNYLREGGEAT